MSENPLGEKTKYPLKYDLGLLFPIPRSPTRSLLDIENNMVMHGIDHWRAYEISWLDQTGKPQVAVGEFFFNSESENIIESKSLKLYLLSRDIMAWLVWLVNLSTYFVVSVPVWAEMLRALPMRDSLQPGVNGYMCGCHGLICNCKNYPLFICSQDKKLIKITDWCRPVYHV